MCPGLLFRSKDDRGSKMSVEEVLEEILKDTSLPKLRWRGDAWRGEPLAQPDFAAAILEASKKKGLHTAIETAGHIPWFTLRRCYKYRSFPLRREAHGP
jgi:pyruvate formate lyase activating enzyme